MPKGILYVESRPSSPDREAEYNRWYDEVHLREVVATEGVVSARRFAPVDGQGPFVAIYEVDADPLESVMDNMGKRAASGEMHMSDALQLDPPPSVRLFRQTSTYEP